MKSISDFFSGNSASLRESAVALNSVEGNIFKRGAAKTGTVALGLLGLSQDLVGGAVSSVNTATAMSNNVFVKESNTNEINFTSLTLDDRSPLFTLNNVTQNDLNRIEAIKRDILENTKGNDAPGFDGKFRARVKRGGTTQGFADAFVDGKIMTIEAFSTHRSFKHYAPLLPDSERQLRSKVIGHDRKVDVEAKILEQILLQTDPSSVGRVSD